MTSNQGAINPCDKGSAENPLTEADLPFCVPSAGLYWISLSAIGVRLLPESPAGSVISLSASRDRDLRAELERAHAVIEAARAFDASAVSTAGPLRLVMREAIVAFDRQATETTA